MKIKRHHATDLRVSDVERENEVQREIDSFLRAVNSYPDRFAREPYLSFQQHLSNIVTAEPPPGADEDSRSRGSARSLPALLSESAGSLLAR